MSHTADASAATPSRHTLVVRTTPRLYVLIACGANLHFKMHSKPSYFTSDLDFAVIDAYAALKDHSDLPTINKLVEPNLKKRKRMQHDRGVKTRKLRTAARSAHAAWRLWKLEHEPHSRCECGHAFKTHVSRQDNTKTVCFDCLRCEPAFQDAFKAKLLHECFGSCSP